MNYNFDFYGRYEKPDLVLCNTDDSEIGHIMNPRNLFPTYKNGNVSELSYEIYCPSNIYLPTVSKEDLIFPQEIYDKHIERRQVHVIGVGYFIITGVSETVNEKGKFKQITAKSCEYELNNVSMPYINGTYALYKPENFNEQTNEEIAQQSDEYLNENCILYEVMKCIPSWKLKQVNFTEKDEYIELANTYRTFEYESMSVYSFLKNVIQDKYSCYVSFDIETRTIEILRRDDVFKELPVIISSANILNECTVSTDIDDYVNSLRVEITNDVSIAPFNPMGGAVIYNFDHDIKSGLITGELKDALEYWNNRLNNQDEQTISITIPQYTADCFAVWKEFDKKVLEFKSKINEKIASDKAESKETESVNYREILNELVSYLKEIGLGEDIYVPGGVTIGSNENIVKETTITTSLANGTCSDSGIIEKVFFGISAQKHKLIKSKAEAKEINLSIPEANRQLLYMQEYFELVNSELSKEESNYKGYDAQLKSLDTVTVEADDNANAAALSYNKSLVGDYILLTSNSIDYYKSVVGSDDGETSGLSGAIQVINDAVQEKYKRNSFEQSFTDFTGDKEKGSKLYAKLTRYLKQQTYQEETIIITEAMGLDEKFNQSGELYKQAVDTLKTISEPQYKMSIKAESFLLSDEFEDIAGQINMRSAIYAEIPNGDVPLFMLESISINYDSSECEITFGNRINPSDPLAIFADLQNTATSTASVVAAERINWGISSEKINELMQAKAADINTTYREMTNSINSVTTGSYGFKCFTEDQKYGIWMANGTAMFIEQDENGNPRSKAAIGRIIKADGSIEYGFYGQSIIANSVTADKLVAGALSKGTNYIRNGSFERTGEYWDLPSGQSGISDSNSTEYFNAPVGQTYLWLNSGKEAVQNLTKSSIVINQGTYVLSFYCRRKNGGADIGDLKGLKIQLFDGESEIARCEFEDNQTVVYANKDIDSSIRKDCWVRCFKLIEINSNLSQPIVKIVNGSAYSVCVDGAMLEKSVDLNEYTPHISETYAKYTTIDDNGITVYNGKIRILNNNGSTVFSADDNGNLAIIGKLTANSGSNIAGWETNDNAIYKDKAGMMSSGDYAFFAGADIYNSNGSIAIGTPQFSVKHDGTLVASSATIKGNIYASYLEATTGGKIANWTITKDALSGGKLILTNNGFITEFDGRSLRFGKEKQSGEYSESDFGSCISMMKSTNNVFNSPNSDNLAIAGRDVIQFGLRGNNGSFEEVGRMYKFSYTGGSNLFNKNVLDINSVKLSNVIIGNIIYSVSAGTAVTGGVVTGIPIYGTFLKLNAFTGTISGMFDWIF